MDIKEKKDSDSILLELKGVVHQQDLRYYPKGEMVCFAIRFDYVFLMCAS